jgi:hypothetical protein
MIRRYLTLTLTLSLTLTALLNPLAAVRAQSHGAQASAAPAVPLAAVNEFSAAWPFESDTARKTVASAHTTIQDSQAPEGDYGDAPDGSLAGYEVPNDQVVGRFPTLYRTTNSRVGATGAHALITDQETLVKECRESSAPLIPTIPMEPGIW